MKTSVQQSANDQGILASRCGSWILLQAHRTGTAVQVRERHD